MAAESLPGTVRRLAPLLAPLARYHRHRLVGAEHVPATGAFLGCLNHSLATYDGFLFALALHRETGRVAWGLGDDKLFQIPGVASLFHASGVRPASHAHARALLAEGRAVWLAPGGMREALRPSTERYTVRWDRRTGFARLAVLTGVPVVLAACPAADDLYTVYPSALTAWAYRVFRVPLPVVRGWGPTVLPRPVALVHYIAPPLWPPPHEPEREEEQVADFHAQCVARMQGLIDDARGA